jgi:hypothetical protein
VADGIAFEKRGIQAATIVTHTFTRAANAMARRHGYPDYHYAMTANPIGNLTPQQIKQRAIELVPEVLFILGIGDGAVAPRPAVVRPK